MGTGSGIQAITAALKQEVNTVVAVDIKPEALIEAKSWANEVKVSEKIEFVLSDLFTEVSGNFDWILFNPPYLPSEGEADELSWAGGKDGIQVIKRFLSEALGYLKKDGSILMVYSSYTKLDETDYNGYKWEKLEEKNVFFETLYCVRLSRI
jgi:release factor glutamine methyltransferase